MHILGLPHRDNEAREGFLERGAGSVGARRCNGTDPRREVAVPSSRKEVHQQLHVLALRLQPRQHLRDARGVGGVVTIARWMLRVVKVTSMP